MARPATDLRSPSRLFFRSAAFALAVLIPALGIPVYFRTDDVHWLSWAIDHRNPLAAFDPRVNLFGYYRPIPTIAWWLLYRLFGFHPLGYQVVLGTVAALSMVPLFRIGARYGGGDRGGFLAVLLFHAGFFPILYYVFWFSALTFGMEILFLLAALDAFTDGPGRPARAVLFTVLALLAGLSKQPALVIIPLAATGLLWNESGDRARRVRWALALWAGAFLLLAVTPFVLNRPARLSGMGVPNLLHFVRARYDFYAGQLLRSPAGPLALAASGCALARRFRGSWNWIPILGGLAGLGLAIVPSLGFPLWCLSLVAAAVAVPASIPWVVGFFVPVFLLLGVDFHVATYLLEPAAMLTVAMVLWSAPTLRAPLGHLERFLDEKVPYAAAGLLPLGLSALMLAALYPGLAPVRTMREVRATFREAVDFLVEMAPRGAVIGTPSYDELGETYADIRERPLGERVEQHKTMNPAQLEKFLRLRGRGDLTVKPVGEAAKTGPPRWLLAVNPSEDLMLARLPGARKMASFQGGQARATIFDWPEGIPEADSTIGR